LPFLSDRITNRLLTALPRLGLSCFGLSLVSGIILAFVYRPVGNVFQNVEEITTRIPYGWFFRQFHYASGQMFVILMFAHTLEHFLKRRYRTYSSREWAVLILSLCLCFFVLFTGFILKGDKEGIFAGRIFMNLLLSIPIGGGVLSRVFIVPGESFFFLPYLYHCMILPFLIGYLIRKHVREWMPGQGSFFWATMGIFVYALLIDPFMDIPPDAPVNAVKGPWFFLGIQTLLKFLPPLWGGLLIPGFLVGCLFLLPLAGPFLQRFLHYLLVASLLLGTYISL